MIHRAYEMMDYRVSPSEVEKTLSHKHTVNIKAKAEKEKLTKEDKANIAASLAKSITTFGNIKGIADTSPAAKVFVKNVCPALSIFANATETLESLPRLHRMPRNRGSE